ncbi:hypothetical protein [Hoeflea sp.]|uniref:hypothetical protein n=1 Tax=Hoeflea sp. TaxID=1940281 RepID=UPI0037498F86
MKKTSIAALAFVIAFPLPLPIAQAQSMSDADKQKMAENVAQADANGDAALSRGEFDMLLQLNAQDKLGRAAQIVRLGRQSMAFNRIDADGNGLVTRQEIQALAQ